MNLHEFIQSTRPPHPCVECGNEAWVRIHGTQWECCGCGSRTCFEYPVTQAGTISVREYIRLQTAA